MEAGQSICVFLCHAPAQFHLIPVHCWLIMFFAAQSMARVNRNDDMTQ